MNASSYTARCSSKGAAPWDSDGDGTPGGGGGTRESGVVDACSQAPLGEMLTARTISSGFTTEESRERAKFKSSELNAGERVMPYEVSGVRGGGMLSEGKIGGVEDREAARVSRRGFETAKSASNSFPSEYSLRLPSCCKRCSATSFFRAFLARCQMQKSETKRTIVETIESAIARPSVVSFTPGELADEGTALSPPPLASATVDGEAAPDFEIVDVAAALFERVDDGLADIDAEERGSADDDDVAYTDSVVARLGREVRLAELLTVTDALADSGVTAADTLPLVSEDSDGETDAVVDALVLFVAAAVAVAPTRCVRRRRATHKRIFK